MAQHGNRMRPAHAPGLTYVSYTPNGRKLVTTGSNDSVRIFDTKSDGEPQNVDDCSDTNTALLATNDFFILGSEDGSVSKYSLENGTFDQLLTRCSLPIRDLSISSDQQWVAVASDELDVKIISIQDMTNVKHIRDLSKPVKHVSYNHGSTILVLSCTDGVMYFYNMDSEQPQLSRKMDGLIRALDSDDLASAACVWHPDGRAFAVPTATHDIQVVSKTDWERQRAFKNGHDADVTAFSWSPNGSLLVSAGKDSKIVLWETKSQRILKGLDGPKSTVVAFSWHPTQNCLSYTTTNGELFIHTDFVPSEHLALLDADRLEPAPFIHDPLKEISGNISKRLPPQPILNRPGTPDSLDDILDLHDSDDGFVEDDDGAGYGEVINQHGKRSHDVDTYAPSKRHAGNRRWEPETHLPFQPGSTPWRGNRRYLCLNLVGCVWIVDQDTHNTVTVEFYDRDLHRDFHFTDPFSYDKACLTEKGALFSNQGSAESTQPSQIYYRPHEHWTSERSDWKVSLPKGESVVSMALSEYVVILTSKNYVRIYTLFGVPVKIFRQKNAPAVVCASWRNYVMTVGNGSIGSDGRPKLQYTIEDVRRDEVCQNEDTVALPDNAEIQNIFFSDEGDPYIYDNTGVLLVLQHWRTQGQAKWVPMLDTSQLERLSGGRKDESYWPVAVAQDRFYCIILKGGDKHPYFPRPLLSDFELLVPHSDTTQEESKRLEEEYIRTSILSSLQEDALSSGRPSSALQQSIAQKTLEIDKLLLQLLASSCLQGEEFGMKGLDIVSLMRDSTGRMLDAAGKIASRFGRSVLREKITELAEKRMVGHDDDDE